MSKTIKIPTSADPFVVIVNNEKYSYPAGETVEVTDHVAEVIENYNDLQPEPGPDTSKPSWNDLRDKPFGEIGGALTWDGNTDGLHDLMGAFRVSDVVPTIDDFANGGSVAFNNGEPIEFKRDDLRIEEFADGMDMIALEIDYSAVYFMIMPDLGEQMAGLGYFPGVYFFHNEERYLASLTINGYNGFSSIKRLDEKFMPLLTSPGGKKFKLSVDDNGTITATEET